jgi:polyketide cyclase/dehydrase/lipid transport protein
MGQYQITRRISASPERVFRAFTEPVLVADWMDGTGVIDWTGPLDRIGTKFTLVIRGPWRFRAEVVRSEPPVVHETIHRGPLGTRVRMMATLAADGDATQLDLMTEYSLPLGPLGRWIDRRWIDREPRAQANREVDRLVELVSRPA